LALKLNLFCLLIITNVLEPTYNHFKAESETLESTNKQKTKVNFTSFEIPVGIRHYFFLNNKSRIFINAEFAVIFNNQITNFSFGIGYNYNKLSFEYRYFPKKEVFDKFKTIKSSDFQNMPFIFGYKVF
jgi:hypothetical protein